MQKRKRKKTTHILEEEETDVSEIEFIEKEDEYKEEDETYKYKLTKRQRGILKVILAGGVITGYRIKHMHAYGKKDAGSKPTEVKSKKSQGKEEVSKMD